jgi:prepilin-type N-terminal cleavage/methylation domain-containing protein
MLQVPPHRRAGFTLLELTVALVLVLAAITFLIPRMSGARSTAEDLDARASADAVLSASVEGLRLTGRFSVDPEVLGALLDPSVDLVDSNEKSLRARQVSAGVESDSTAVAVAVLGGSGVCWYARRALSSRPGDLAAAFAFRPSGGSALCTAEVALESLRNLPATGTGGGWERPLTLG